MPRPPTKTIEIRDFTPGIADLPSAHYPPGQAQRTNTYRCISYPGGALGPGPRRVTTYDGVDFAGHDPTVGEKYLITGMFTAGPVVPSSGATVASDRLHEMFLATEYVDAGNRTLKIERLRLDENPVVREVIKTITNPSTDTTPHAWGMTWGTTRTNKAAPASPGIPVVVGAWADVSDLTKFYTFTFPDDATPTLNTPYEIPGTKPALIICHQGRIVLREVTGYSHGVNGTWSTTEDLVYTAVYNPASLSATLVVVPELPNGYPCGVAMTANELFLLKETGGVRISGDIADPIVTNLPMVPGVTDGQTGVRTPVGFMYGNRYSGVWVWGGGDGAQHLSPGLYPAFWTLDAFASETLTINRYSWESYDSLVFLSNNWVYNTDTNGWWRLDDQTLYPVRHFSKQRNFLYGARTSYRRDALPAVYSWDMNLNAIDYSWQSQPLWETLDHTVVVEGVYIRVKGAGTVIITITAQDGTSMTKTSATFNYTVPTLIRGDFAVRGSGITVRIESVSTGSTNDAPTVYECNVNYHEEIMTPDVMV